MLLDEAGSTTSPHEVTAQIPTTSMCAERFCLFSNNGRFVDLTDFVNNTSHNLSISISIGVLCILAVSCIITMILLFSKFWHRRCKRNNKVTPGEMNEMELGELCTQQNTDEDEAKDVPSVCANVKTIEVIEARPSKVLDFPSQGRSDIDTTSRFYVQKCPAQKQSMSCPGFCSDTGYSTDTTF